MEEKCPHCKVLFAPWARARTAVLSRTFDGSEEDKIFQNQALELYRKAFDEGRNYAGAYLKHFLEESIAVSVYFDRRRTQDIPKVIDEDKTLKTPVTDDAKRYYEYGYALNLFEQESAETFLLHFRSREHFWKVFFPSAFVHVEAAENQEGQDMLKAKGLYLFEGDTKDPEKVKEWTAAVRHTKELQNITEKTINRRMEWLPGHDIQYTPLSIALFTGQLDMAEKYLEDFKNTLDVAVINTHGSTALSEAITQYKNRRFTGSDSESICLQLKRYKAIILELIKRSPVDALYAETVKGRISDLEEAINGDQCF